MFHYNRDSEIPAHTQIIEQVKVALALGRLRAGDVLPSIRAVEAATGIGRMIVRKAYQKLDENGFVELKHGKGAVVAALPSHNDDLIHRAEQLISKYAAEIDREGLDFVSFSRLFHQRMLARDSAQPRLICTDPSAVLADELGKQIEERLRISVRCLSLTELDSLDETVVRSTSFAINYYYLQELRELLPNDHGRIFPLSWSYAPGLLEQVRSLPLGSELCVLYTESAIGGEGTQLAFQELRRSLEGRSFRMHPLALERIDDPLALADRDYRAALISNRVWDLHQSGFEKRPDFFFRLATRLNKQSLEEIKTELGLVY